MRQGSTALRSGFRYLWQFAVSRLGRLAQGPGTRWQLLIAGGMTFSPPGSSGAIPCRDRRRQLLWSGSYRSQSPESAFGVRLPLAASAWDGHATLGHLERRLQRYLEREKYPSKLLSLVARNAAFYASGTAIFPEKRER